MKVKCLLLSLAFIALVFAACGDDPASPKKKSGPTPFNTSQMPIILPNTTYGYGNMAVDGAGNLLVPCETGILYRVNKTTGAPEVVAANVGLSDGGPYDLMCCVYNPAASRIYAGIESGDPSRIYSINPSNGSSQLLVDLGDNGYICQLLMAPAGFGAFAGYLLVFTYQGGGSGIVAVNPGSPGSPAAVSSVKCNAAAFGPDGTLYVVDRANNRVVTVSSTGVVTDYLTSLSFMEGIAVNTANNRMYIARVGMIGGVDSLYSVTMPGKIISTLGFQPDLDDGWYPTGVILDGAGKILFNGDETAKAIDFFNL